MAVAVYLFDIKTVSIYTCVTAPRMNRRGVRRCALTNILLRRSASSAPALSGIVQDWLPVDGGTGIRDRAISNLIGFVPGAHSRFRGSSRGCTSSGPCHNQKGASGAALQSFRVPIIGKGYAGPPHREVSQGRVSLS